jgi:hypothetical protein
MTDNGVRDHRDEYDDEVWPNPRIRRVTCQCRQDQVASDCAATTDRKAEEEVLELRTRQATGASPL